MCLNPRTITRKIAGKFYQYTFPCGHCIECLHKKRSQIAVSTYRTAQKFKDAIFVTFTYRDEALPFAFQYHLDGDKCDDNLVLSEEKRSLMFLPYCDEDTGEVNSIRSLYFDQPYEVYVDKKGLKHRIHQRYVFDRSDIIDGLSMSVCPSLSRRDLRLSIKRGRISYYRNHNKENLPEFKYIICGEYSPVCHRPHFHGLFMGLTYSQVNELTKDWRENFGFTCIKKVRNLKQGSDGKLAVSMYVGKYIVKGDCEYDEVSSGLVEKPRRMVSKFFGEYTDLEQNLISHYLAFDICKYDPDNVYPLMHDRDKCLSVLFTIYKRLNYEINGRKYSLPDGIVRSLFRRKVVCFDEIKSKYVPRQIWSLVSAFVRSRFLKDFEERIQSTIQKSLSEVSLREISSICSGYENDRHSLSETLQENYLDFIRHCQIL